MPLPNTTILAAAVALCASSALADPLQQIEGAWGSPIIPDMSCKTNPMHIQVSRNGAQLVLSWGDVVKYSDGSRRDHDTFRITSIKSNVIHTRRERDGELGSFRLRKSGDSFYFSINASPDTGSEWNRCN
jgi:hypothetical protein